MPSILLIQPPLQDFYFTAKRSFPYGLACIAANLEAHGFEVEILDALATSKSRVLEWPDYLNYLRPYYSGPDLSPMALFARWRHFGYSYAHIFGQIKASKAFLVGISSLFSAYSDQACMMASLAKQARPHCRTVIGGHHATQCPEAVMAHPDVDYVIRGEGENAMQMLAQALWQGLSLDDVPGLAYRSVEGHLIIKPPAIAANLDRQPPPALHRVNLKYYQRHHAGSTAIVTSRGCPLQCSYCATGKLSAIPYRRRRLAGVMQEIEAAVYTHGVRFIDFEDENLSLERKWFKALMCELIHRYGAFNLELRAMNGLLPDTLNAELIALMQQAGFKILNLALGSSNPLQLKRFRRPDVRNAFDAALKACLSQAMSAVGYILIAAPQQTATDSVNDLLFLARRPVLAAISPFYPAPGSADWKDLQRRNLLPANMGQWRASVLPVELETSRLETVTLLRLGRILNFMKHLRQQGLRLPAPTGPKHAALDLPLDRVTIGRILLGMFFKEGRIFGLSPSGKIFEHLIARDVARQFLKGLESSILGEA